MIPLADGTRLAVTLYLPPADALPTPCLLEALPYRKDDLTASYRPEYARLRDEHGYAVARLDLRGTGSSDGLAVDEYPAQEQRDLCEVIAWLAGQQWCTGAVGMYGTSYSGFNSIQVACERPPELKAIIAIYATDDRYTDDVQLMGGARRLLDLVDYPTYMVAMNALPPVPSLVGDEWVESWRARVELLQPWVLRWLEEQRDSPYWRHGSLRPGYDRIACPTMLVGGWADGYRNNTFRTAAALAAAGTPHRLLLGPWSHMSTENSLPGPNIDLVPVMARWWDRWLRGQPDHINGEDINGEAIDDEPALTWFQQHSTRPGAARRAVNGEWRSAPAWPLAGATVDSRPLGEGVVTYDVLPDVGTSAWNSCAASLPWGQPTDQRYDDAASLTWSWPADGLTLLGHPRLRLRVASSAPVAFVSAKLSDVFPDGTSSLLTRGLLNLTHRSSSTDPSPLPVDEFLDIEIELEAMSWTATPGHQLRLSLAGVDWPNTLAPPGPLTLTIDVGGSSVHLPLAGESAPTTDPLILWTPTHRSDGVSGAREPTNEEAGESYGAAADDPGEGVVWRIERDVLGHRTECVVDHGSAYDVEGGGVVEHYAGRVWVDTESFAQGAESSADFTVRWPEGIARSRAELTWVAGPTAYDVVLTVETWRDGEPFADRRWQRTIERDLT
jgi:predicted acyl esterase